MLFRIYLRGSRALGAVAVQSRCEDRPTLSCPGGAGQFIARRPVSLCRSSLTTRRIFGVVPERLRAKASHCRRFPGSVAKTSLSPSGTATGITVLRRANVATMARRSRSGSEPIEQGLDLVATEVALAGDEGSVGLACKRRCSDTVKSTVRTPGTALDRVGRSWFTPTQSFPASLTRCRHGIK